MSTIRAQIDPRLWHGYAVPIMKLWLKYAIGMLLGTLLYFILPSGLLQDGGVLAKLSELSIHVGAYILVPLLCVNLSLSTMKLYEDRKFWGFALKACGFYLLSLLTATAAGMAGALVALPVHVPLLADTASQAVPNFNSSVFEIFPQNLASVFLRSGEYLVPVLFLFLVIGLAMSHDSSVAKPFASVLDSLSSILGVINVFITEILEILLIPITTRGIYLANSSISSGLYASFLQTLLLEALVLILVIMPLVIFLLNGRKNPYPILYAGLGAALASLASGDLRFSSGSIMRSVHENLGLQRRHNSILLPAGLLFGRVGTAFITASSFVIIISSYSRMGVSFANLLWMLFAIPFATVFMSSSLQNGPAMVLAFLCYLFGKGFENGYLVMIPLSFILAAIASCIDSIWIAASEALFEKRMTNRKEIPAARFI
ncbi:MAG: dicarboxylate/amino acid:cation symporter [Spirochaetaceae bacterium]|nr:dicarboxylate/amino acid:cation symporter [Spirochaetaceae bacterium]